VEYVALDDVHKSFHRRFGAATLTAHQERAEVTSVDHALRGVGFVVSEGEAVGVLGTRRSGRSTLISLIAGMYKPDLGRVVVRGRVVSLTAVSAGFVPRVSLRAGIEMNARLLGTPEDVLEKTTPVALDFAGLTTRDLSYPIQEIEGVQKRRLGYALAVLSAPDVLLADNDVVLGSAEVREACYAMLEQLRDGPHALVLATNKREALSRLCSRVVVLDAGEIVYEGPVRGGLRKLRELRS
jgi:ABC-type polysaccharide/polyol phosphate transport system ATPase subunit